MKWIQKKPKVKPNKSDSPIEMIGKIRGIEDVDYFLNPTEKALHDPYLMKNIEEASNRLIYALTQNQRVIFSCDPDADGITSLVTMLRYAREYSDNVDYIYGERSDGHGIESMLKVNELIEEGLAKGLSIEEIHATEKFIRNKENTDKVREADLVVLLDSSTNDVEACKFIVEQLQTEVIILDHHKVEKKNPYAILVNPQQEDCKYPNKHLSGAGVVLKVMQVMEDTLGGVDFWKYSDLVAVGMYSDMMRVDVMENRYIISNGLRNLRNTGLIRICKGAKINTFNGLTGDNIGFGIAPLINGVARMDSIKLAIEILLEDDDAKCKPIRLKMQKINESKRVIQDEIMQRYSVKIDSSQKVIIVSDEESSKGFNGIVAQQLSDKYKRPVIVGRSYKGVLSGSFRSYNGFDLNTFFKESGVFKEVGGHPQAGGISIEEKNLDFLNEYINANMPDLEETEPFAFYDLEIEANEVSEFVSAVEKFNHLAGSGFPRVTVRVNGITVDETAIIGKTMETLKIKTFSGMELIKFRVPEDYASELGVYDDIDAVGQLSINVFYNFKTKVTTKTPQLMFLDYKMR